MIWVLINRRSSKMGLIRNQQIIACLFLLLLIRLEFDHTCSSSSSSSCSKVEGTSRLFNKFRSSEGDHHHSSSQDHHKFNTTIHDQSKNGFDHHEGSFINGSSNGDDSVFDVDKRRIHTGPNPLHNKR